MNYYQTTPLTPQELQTNIDNATGQDECILAFFKKMPYGSFTPDEILLNVFGNENVPLTSVRRSIYTLTKGLYLEKTDNMKLGTYGKMVHTWRLRTNKGQLQLL